MISGLAALYIIGYLLLLLTDPSYLVWSSVFRGFSILVWPMVWILPAITSINLWRELQLRVMEEVDK